jgi:hypothetical protein
VPLLPKFSLPGLALHQAMSSAVVRTGRSGWTCSTKAVRNTMPIGARSRCGSFGPRLGCSAGLIASVEVPISSVYPSGRAWATAVLATAVAAPARFSTTRVWPSARPIRSATAREVTSVTPPGA